MTKHLHFGLSKALKTQLQCLLFQNFVPHPSREFLSLITKAYVEIRYEEAVNPK